jgi:hypothetical protein
MQDQLQNQQLGSPVEQASEAAEKVSLPEAQTKVCITKSLFLCALRRFSHAAFDNN